MTPPVMRPRDKRSTAAALQFLREAAGELIAAEQQRLEAMRWISSGSVDPLKALDALAAHRRGQEAADAALAKYMASLRLAGISAHAIGRAQRTRTATVAARTDAHPEARRIRHARGADIKKSSTGYVIQPPAPRSTVTEEL
nr:hypothetical protein [Mycobacterium sp. UM_NZ2]